MSKAKKILLSILAVVILLLATCGIAYAVAPRDFLQLILSDSAYTKVMLAKNLTKGYPAAEKVIAGLDEKQLGFEASGDIDVTFDSTAFGSASASQAVSEYASSLKMDADLFINGVLAKGTVDISDNSGSVITAETIIDPSSVYMNIKQLGLSWLNMDIKNDETQHDIGVVNEAYENIIEEKADDDLREAVYDYAATAVSTFEDNNISIASKKEINIGSLTAEGDVVTVVLQKDELINCIDTTVARVLEDEKTFEKINACLPESEKTTYEEFKTKLTKARNDFVEKIESTGVQTATLDFFVDSRNDITAIDIDFGAGTVVNNISVLLKDKEDRGISLKVESDSKVIFLLDLLKTDDESGKITLTKETANGELTIKASYSGLSIEDDGIYGRIATEPFTLPGNEEFGPITLEATVKQVGDSLSVYINADIEGFANMDINLSAEKVPYRDFARPVASEISPYNKEKFRAAAVEYFFKDMPDEHPQFKSVYSAFLTSAISGSVSNLIDALTGDDNVIGEILGNFVNGDSLSSAINGIIDSALNGDTSHIGDIVDDFFGAFGLK